MHGLLFISISSSFDVYLFLNRVIGCSPAQNETEIGIHCTHDTTGILFMGQEYNYYQVHILSAVKDLKSEPET